MFLTIVFRFPHLSRAVTTACKALLWAVALLTALALCVAVAVAVAPYLPTLATVAATIGGYGWLTYPRSRAVRA